MKAGSRPKASVQQRRGAAVGGLASLDVTLVANDIIACMSATFRLKNLLNRACVYPPGDEFAHAAGRCGARALAWCVLAVLPTHTFAQASEYELKAAFLYNFALFTQPAEAASTPVAGEKEPYRICIFGKDPFGAAGMALAARTIAGRQIVLKHHAAIDELKQCQLVFIAESDHESARRVTGAVSGLPIITVGEFKDFPAVGVIFNLAVVDEKVAFQVDMQVARKQQLEVSAKLTRLATSVR